MLHIFLPSQTLSIFSFSIFVSALALLSIVYTITDIRYRFRIAVAPYPLHKITYCLITFIGFGSLLTDLWFAKKWPMWTFLNDQLILQSIFGSLFLLIVLVWLWYAFIRPPIFDKNNYKKFTQVFYSMLVKGSENELPALANELERSANSIIMLVNETSPHSKALIQNKRPDCSDYAHDFLLLIGNRKLCRYIINTSPGTALAFFKAMSDHKKYLTAAGIFSKNISTEALINKDSILFHEDEGYRGGLIGYQKPFSNVVYGNYLLVEAVGQKGCSPLDIDLNLQWSWDANQLEVYCRCVLITFSNYLETGNLLSTSHTLSRAFYNIEKSCSDIYKLNDEPSLEYSTDQSNRLRVVVSFITDAINILDAKDPMLIMKKLRIHERDPEDLYDHFANLMFEIIYSAASVQSPKIFWHINHNTVWSAFFDNLHPPQKALKIILHKLRRLIYNEICELKNFPNYKSSKILGVSLNIMGLQLLEKNKYRKDYYPLHKAILNWTKNNYLSLRTAELDVANSCLMYKISLDEKNSCLVKKYEKILGREAQEVRLPLNPA